MKGNIYFISGTFETGSRISKLDKDGNILWSTKPNTSGGDWYTDLEVLGSNVYAVGGTTQAGRFNAAMRAKVLNLDTSGQQIFSKTYDIEGAGSFRSVTTDGKDLYVSASPYGRRDFDSAIAAKLDGSNIARVIWQNRIGGDWNSEGDGTIFGDYFVSNGYKADGGDRQDNRIIYRDIKTGKVVHDKSWGDGNSQTLHGLTVKDGRLFGTGIDGIPWNSSNTKGGFAVVYEFDKDANIIDTIKLDVTNDLDNPQDIISTDNGYVITGVTKGFKAHDSSLFANYRQLTKPPSEPPTTSVKTSALLSVNQVNDGPELTGTQATLTKGKEDNDYIIKEADLLQGFSDVDGDKLQVKDLKPSAEFGGSFKANNNGTWTYTPEANDNGTIKFDYTVSMDMAEISKPATALS